MKKPRITKRTIARAAKHFQTKSLLARYLGISRQHLNAIYQGKRPLPAAKLPMLAAITNIEYYAPTNRRRGNYVGD
jgi:transcriptional regulator with XRE-family HTH domain